jgi:hypothetical protein
MKKQTYREVEAKLIGFAQEKPFAFIVMLIVVIVMSAWVLTSLQFLPETFGLRKARGVVVEEGDSYDWIGMQVVPLNRGIRTEFKVPAKVKGMFVLDEGNGAAKKYGVKTGDVIVSISRKPVPSARAFIEVANAAQYYEGIMLDIYRDKKALYLTVPFEYQYGPLYGPNKRSWQLGAPLWGQALPYGPMVDTKNNRER